MTRILDAIGLVTLFVGTAIWVAVLRSGLSRWREAESTPRDEKPNGE